MAHQITVMSDILAHVFMHDLDGVESQLHGDGKIMKQLYT